jgi:hypothetical protein
VFNLGGYDNNAVHRVRVHVYCSLNWGGAAWRRPDHSGPTGAQRFGA